LICYSRACGSYRFLHRELLLTRKLLNQGFLVVKLKSLLESFTVATMTWLTVTEYLCHKWPLIFFGGRNHNLVLFSFRTFHRLVTRVTWRVPLEEQELLILQDLISFSVWVFKWVCREQQVRAVLWTCQLFELVCRILEDCSIVWLIWKEWISVCVFWSEYVSKSLLLSFPGSWVSWYKDCAWWYTGADPGFQVRGGALKKIVWKSRFYAKKSYFFQF
jgi:hypothetical protein